VKSYLRTSPRRANIAVSNGHTPGITLPGVQGQEDVIRKAYASAQLDLAETIYVEVRGVPTIMIRILTSM
jgi:acyl transferase domain-containing protein